MTDASTTTAPNAELPTESTANTGSAMNIYGLPAPASVAPTTAPTTASLSPPIRPSVLRPTWRFMLSHPAHSIALGFGSGLSRIAPGTAGTLWAWAAFAVMQLYLTPAQIGWVIAASLPIGWWACTITAQHMRVMDPGNIVWDEVIAMWIILWLISPASLTAQLVAFALFRFFDAVKPGPVAWADGVFKGFNAKGGFGIIFDDLVAAACTLLVIALWKF